MMDTRKITGYCIVEADLVLETPAHFGNGDGKSNGSSSLVDMPLLVDAYDGVSPLLTGSTVAGALRAYLTRQNSQLASELFGVERGKEDGLQSHLIIDDSVGLRSGGGVEIRNGVKINGQSYTAEHDALYNMELWAAGTRFRLRFELILTEDSKKLTSQTEDSKARVQSALVRVLYGLDSGDITLGARKSRGYGRIRMENWHLRTFDCRKSDGLWAWIQDGDKLLDNRFSQPSFAALCRAVGAKPLLGQPDTFVINAEFSLNGSLLVRGAQGDDDL